MKITAPFPDLIFGVIKLWGWNQNHRKQRTIQVGRDLRRSLIQLLAHSRVSCEVRTGCSGLCPVGS